MSELHVTFRVGDADYVVPANEVLHLETFETATPVPGAPSYVAGLVQVRGRLVPVVDLRARFGLPPVEHATGRRVVVVQSGARVVGLLVDSAREVLQLEPSAFEAPPEVLVAERGQFVKAVAVASKRLFMLVDIPRVIAEEVHHAR
jgi:purine-binding chemotaxis protein CheW